MLEIFSRLADWVTYDVFGLPMGTRLSSAVHFFVEDVSKIYVLLIVMIYLVALVRASLNVERVRDFLSGKPRALGYGLGAGFGAITPFCSCSSIPVFLGFTSAGIPLGMTMAFLLTSPLINEVAVLLLVSLIGWQFTLIYVVSGLAIGALGGALLDRLKAHRYLMPFAARLYTSNTQTTGAELNASNRRMTLSMRHTFALSELRDIFKRVWYWVIIGVGIGASIHGFVPAGWIEANLSSTQLWTVPAAVVAGIPLYSNATGVIPVMESLLNQGMPIGTTLAFCMSTVAVSIPEFILLKQVMQWRLLATVIVLLLIGFTISGWILNAFGGM